MGVEGPFRRACEVTMSVVRENRDLLFNVLESFVNDPLVEWSSAAATSPAAAAAAAAAGPAIGLNQATLLMQEQALKHMYKIEQRLRGVYAGGGSGGGSGQQKDALSIRGQVDHLMSEAASRTNLSQMYIGWMSWL
jgi:serine/threonine-protein kinase ATR